MSSRSLNKVMLIGNLTRDVEVRYTPSGTAVATFGLATNRTWSSGDGSDRQEEVQFHRIVAWSKLGEICGQLLFKGRKVFIEGRLQTRKFTGQDGVQREITEIVAENMMILDTKNREGNGGVVNEDPTSYSTSQGQEEIPSTEPTTDTVVVEEEKVDKAKKKPVKATKTEETAISDEVNVEDIPF